MISKRANTILSALLLICCYGSSYSQSKTADDKGKAKQPSAQPQPIVVYAISPQRTDKEINDDKAKAEHEKSAKRYELILSLVIAGAAITQAIIAYWQGHIYRRQYVTMTEALEESRASAVAATKGIAALEKIERPFLVIERRGPMKSEFWAVNYGKTSAQILFIEPILSISYPAFNQRLQDWHMPFPPNYGLHYEDPRWETINIEWIPPGKDYFVNMFEPSILRDLPESLQLELNNGQRRVRMFSAIKYRGLVSDEIFESRYCCGWSNAGTHLAGSPGYNKYT